MSITLQNDIKISDRKINTPFEKPYANQSNHNSSTSSPLRQVILLHDEHSKSLHLNTISSTLHPPIPRLFVPQSCHTHPFYKGPHAQLKKIPEQIIANPKRRNKRGARRADYECFFTHGHVVRTRDLQPTCTARTVPYLGYPLRTMSSYLQGPSYRVRPFTHLLYPLGAARFLMPSACGLHTQKIMQSYS